MQAFGRNEWLTILTAGQTLMGFRLVSTTAFPAHAKRGSLVYGHDAQMTYRITSHAAISRVHI